MPTRRLARRSIRSTRARRRTQWVDVDLSGSVAIGHFDNLDLLGNYRPMTGAETVGITIMRTHARLWVTNGVTVGDGIAWGFIVMDQSDLGLGQALAAAHTSNPIDDPYEPWMLYQKWNAHPGYSFTSPNNQFEADLKSKRRVPFGDTYAVSLVNQDAAQAVTYAFHARTLIALS